MTLAVQVRAKSVAELVQGLPSSALWVQVYLREASRILPTRMPAQQGEVAVCSSCLKHILGRAQNSKAGDRIIGRAMPAAPIDHVLAVHAQERIASKFT